MTDQAELAQIAAEIGARRTFAIISHPDAGKTTLTEKLLLYSGMIRTAGMVRGRKGSKAASSDWMGMEQERGISITASAMQFRYKDALINVLDTPGHQDFSEDTYRTLTAADSAVMVIDASKGVETQTKKLFAVCRMRNIPVLTFMNKLDLNARDPFELMEEVENLLGVKASPLNWPVGYGKEFCGIAEIASGQVMLFSRTAAGGSQKAGVRIVPLAELKVSDVTSEAVFEQLQYELELLKEAGNPFSREQFLRGEVTPVFFGSALTNYGVEPFFDHFVELAPPPGPRPADTDAGDEILIDAVSRPFSAYVFKVQANMNPRHRDSMAFLRVCSGKFEREIPVKHHRLKREIRLSRSHSMLAGERSTLDVAYAGDIIGAINPGTFAIGDTVSLEGGFNFKPLPQFPPEVVAQIRPIDVSKRKAFDKGMQQLSQEGAVQVLRSWDNPLSEPYVAAVGKLQFDVLQYRLKEEYGVDTKLDSMSYECGVWLTGDLKSFKKPSAALLVRDVRDRPVLLFRSAWEKQYAADQNPNHKLIDFID
ncbi:MAG: peptide chain release factor 3 [Bdellovibrionota bacterium]